MACRLCQNSDFKASLLNHMIYTRYLLNIDLVPCVLQWFIQVRNYRGNKSYGVVLGSPALLSLRWDFFDADNIQSQGRLTFAKHLYRHQFNFTKQ